MRPATRNIDDRELLPVPGAFGFDKQQQVQHFRRRADKDFLDGTGHYAGYLRIHVEEECGYRDWLWTYPGTIKQLVQDWKDGRRPISPSRRVARNYHAAYSGRGYFDGELDEIYWDRDYYMGADGEEHVYRWPCLAETGAALNFATNYARRRTEHNGFDGFAHIHQQDDSYLSISYYELRGLDDVEETVAVLDALADIL